jgi:hypothetical protein
VRAGRQAGVNIELPEPDCYLHLVELVRKGVLQERNSTNWWRRCCFWKFQLGLFDDPYVDPDEAERVVGCDAHTPTGAAGGAREHHAAEERRRLLPLDPARIKTIAVIGPNADRSLLGGYSGVPKRDVTVLEGIRARLGKRVKVLYSEGCKITIGGSWQQDEVTPSDPGEDRKQIAEAVKVARKADVIVLAIGGNEQTSREAWSPKHLGDRRASTWWAGRKNWSRRCWPPASRWSCCCSTAGRFPSTTSARTCRRFWSAGIWARKPARGGGGAVRRFQPRRQAADHDSAVGRPSAGVLQLQALRPPRLPVRRRLAALRLRLRVELHHLPHCMPCSHST